jgi:hypothetical protein
MKTLIFILLKIGEVSLIFICYVLISIFGYYYHDKIFCIILDNCKTLQEACPEYNIYIFPFFIGIMHLSLIYLIGMAIYGLIINTPRWIASNKKLTDKIYNKIFK